VGNSYEDRGGYRPDLPGIVGRAGVLGVSPAMLLRSGHISSPSSQGMRIRKDTVIPTGAERSEA